MKNIFLIYTMTELKQPATATATPCAKILERGAGKSNTKFRWAFILLNTEFLIRNYKDIADELKKCKFDYYLAGWHRGEKDDKNVIQKDHIHIFIQYKYAREMGVNFLRKIYNAHVAPHEKYNPTAIIRYIKCDDKKHKNEEWGSEIIEEIGVGKTNNQFPSIAEVREMPKEERDQLGIQYKNINKELDELDMKKKIYTDKIHHRRKQIEVSYYFGTGGTGKTEMGYCELEKYEDEEGGILTFDDTGKGELENPDIDTTKIKILLINEFRDSQIKFCDFLAYLLNEKPIRKLYGYYYFPNLEKIVITSSQDPYHIYPNKLENRKQIYRRLTYVYKMDGDYDFETQEPESINGWFGWEYFELKMKQESNFNYIQN